jgi:hypothetical protein
MLNLSKELVYICPTNKLNQFMKKNIILSVALAFVVSIAMNAQDKVASKGKSLLTSSPWTFSLGWAAIDDDGRKFEKMFDVKDGWNYNLFPAQIGAMKKVNDKLSADLGFTYAKYDAKHRNGENLYEEGTFWAFDVNTRYALYAKKVKSINMELQSYQGLGFTQRNPGLDKNCPTLNTGLGINFWVKENWGIALSSQAKWGLTNLSDGGSYLHHGLTFFYVAK